MKQKTFRRLLDACFVAKRITETMQDLPKGFKPRHMHVIGAIYELGENSGEVRVSDVSAQLQVTTPSVTKLINELEGYEVVEKYNLMGDKRVTLLRLTSKGEAYYKHYIEHYHTLWLEAMGGISDAEVEVVTRLMDTLLDTMPDIGPIE